MLEGAWFELEPCRRWWTTRGQPWRRSRPDSTEVHEVGDMEVFDHTEWSSTCPLLVAVLTETYRNRPGELSSGAGMRSAPNLADLSYLLYDYVVQRVWKGERTPPAMIVESEERQMIDTLHRLMGSLARRL